MKHYRELLIVPVKKLCRDCRLFLGLNYYARSIPILYSFGVLLFKPVLILFIGVSRINEVEFEGVSKSFFGGYILAATKG